MGKNQTNEVIGTATFKETLAAIQRNIGKEKMQIVRHDNQAFFTPNYIPSGIASLDIAMEGGIQQGKTTMIAGQENGGKTFVALNYCREALEKFPDKYVVYRDNENMLDVEWAKIVIGKELFEQGRFIICYPSYGEQSSEIVESMVKSKEVSLIVVDSIAVLTSGKEMLKAAEESEKMASRAKLVSSLCNRLTVLESNMKTQEGGFVPTTIFINQLTSSMSQYGSPYTYTSGKRVRYKSVNILMIKNTKTEEINDQHGILIPSHNIHAFEIKKDKNILFRSGEFILVRNDVYGLPMGDIDNSALIYKFLFKVGLIKNKGILGLKENIGLKEDIIRELASDKNLQKVCTREIIKVLKLAKNLRLLPPDNYLICSKEMYKAYSGEDDSKEAAKKLTNKLNKDKTDELTKSPVVESEGKESTKQSKTAKPRARKASS